MPSADVRCGVTTGIDSRLVHWLLSGWGVAEAEDTPLIEVRNPIQPIGSSNEAWVYDTVCFLGGSVVQPTVGLLNPR
jgi:hypothetical protein